MTHGEETEESGMEGWWEHISEDKKKAFMKAKLDMKIKKVQAKLDFLKELQKIFGLSQGQELRASRITLFRPIYSTAFKRCLGGSYLSSSRRSWILEQGACYIITV